MLRGLGDLANLQGIIRQALDIKGRVEAFSETLANERIEASAGADMVTVVMTGKFELVSIKIDPEIINKDDPGMLETMVLAAVNEGVRKTQELVKSKMTEMTGGMDLPGLT